MTRPEYDQKYRWSGILECPWVSRVQRDLLDYGRVQGLRRVTDAFAGASFLDVGCGLGDTVEAVFGSYVGIDNSPGRVAYARRRYSTACFVVGDAVALPFRDNAVDVGLLIDTSHHLSDTALWRVLTELARVCRGHIVVSDPVTFEGQGPVSRFFYGLDRGGAFRSVDTMRQLCSGLDALRLESEERFDTFPGIYRHHAFVFSVRSSEGKTGDEGGRVNA